MLHFVVLHGEGYNPFGTARPPGGQVNLETDLLAKYAEKELAGR